MGEDHGVVSGERLELVLGAHERQPRKLGDLGGEGFGEKRARIEAGSDRRSSLGKLVKCWKRKVYSFDSVFDLCRITAEFLPQSERGCVLQMRIADVEDGLDGFGLCFVALLGA